MRKAFEHVMRFGAALTALVGLVGAGEPAPTQPAALPPIVFVARDAASGAAVGQIPGLGPHGTFVVGRGGLFERASNGTVAAATRTQ